MDFSFSAARNFAAFEMDAEHLRVAFPVWLNEPDGTKRADVHHGFQGQQSDGNL